MAEFEVQSSFSNILRKLETTDPAHADIFNALFQQLINNDTYLSNKIGGEYINVMILGAKADGKTDDSPIFQKALDMAKERGSVSIVVPGGPYLIDKTLILYKNTTIELLAGATLKRGPNCGILFINAEKTDVFKDYAGNGNIRIVGGTFDMRGHELSRSGSCFSLAHARNIFIENIEIRNVRDSHGFDLAGCRSVRILNSRFMGYVYTPGDPSTIRNYSEAIQIDQAQVNSFPGFPEAFYDGTACKDITVNNCIFTKSDELGAWNRVFGTHNLYVGGSSEYKKSEDLFFESNTIEGTSVTSPTEAVAVRFTSFNNCVIENNIFRYVKGAVSVEVESSPKNMAGVQIPIAEDQAWSNLVIQGNQIFDCAESNPITVRGYDPLMNTGLPGSVEVIARDVIISDNIVKTAKLVDGDYMSTVSLRKVRYATIANNVSRETSRFIYANACFGVTVSNNTVSDTLKESIYANDVRDLVLDGNSIVGSNEEAIELNNCSNFVVSNNAILNNNLTSKLRSIHAYGTCEDGVITDNVVTANVTLVNGIEVTSTGDNVITSNNSVNAVTTNAKVSNLCINGGDGVIVYSGNSKYLMGKDGTTQI